MRHTVVFVRNWSQFTITLLNRCTILSTFSVCSIFARYKNFLFVCCSIRVGKVDCTRFKVVCHYFKVQGYPTIMFIRGNNEYSYNGERSKEELVHFALRMAGPAVQQVTRVESFEILKANNPIFFIYVGKQSGTLWDNYYIASETNQAFGYFYATSAEVASKHFFIDSTPTILVYKENTHYTFPLSDMHDVIDAAQINASLHTWITSEKFLTFPKITRGLLLTRCFSWLY